MKRHAPAKVTSLMACLAVPLALFETAAATGEAILEVMPEVDHVQRSNYGQNSFTIRNTGTKDIVEFRLDVRDALYPGSVFDPEGLAGDSVAKAIQIDHDQDTGVIPPHGISPEVYLGAGGTQGYHGIALTFERGGFNPGERLGFSVDMDPNSIAGTEKKPLDAGTIPKWDAGGVSGAELIGSRFTVTFADGGTASGQLFGTGTQAGSQGIASETPREETVELTVNGLEPGKTGTFSSEGATLRIKGVKGSTARVILTKGTIQPIDPYNETLGAQLLALAAQPFPANNAAEFLTIDVEMTGEVIDLSDRFAWATVAAFDFHADPDKPLSVAEDQLPVGIVAAAVDPERDHLPVGPVTAPIYLRHR